MRIATKFFAAIGLAALLPIFLYAAAPRSGAAPTSDSAPAPSTSGATTLKDAVFLISAPDLKRAWGGISQTPFYTVGELLLRDMQSNTDSKLPSALRSTAATEKELGFSLSPANLMGGVIRGGSFSVAAPKDAKSPPTLLLHLTLADGDKFARLFSKYDKSIREFFAGNKPPRPGAPRLEKIGGVDLLVYATESGAKYYAGATAAIFAMSNNPDAVIQAMSGGGPDLAQPPGAARMIGKLKNPNPTVTLYVQNAEFLEYLSSMAANASQAVALTTPIFGDIRAFKAMALGIGFAPGELIAESVMDVDSKAPSASVLRFLNDPGELRAMKYAPATALFVTASDGFDVKNILETMRASAPPGDTQARAEIEDAIKEFETQIGVSVQNELAPAIGPQMLVAVNGIKIDTENFWSSHLDITAGFQIRDEAKLRAALPKMEKAIARLFAGADEPATFKSEEYQGLLLRTLKSPVLPNMSPGYAVDGDFIVFNTTAQNLKAAIDCRLGKVATAAQNPALESVRARFGHETSNSINLIRVGAVIQSLRDTLLPALRPLLADTPSQLATVDKIIEDLSALDTAVTTQRWTGEHVHQISVLTYKQ